MKKIRIISFTENGLELSGRMAEILDGSYQIRQYFGGKQNRPELPDSDKIQQGSEEYKITQPIPVTAGLKNWCESVFYDSDAIIFIGASGIAVRTIAPFIESKVKDPAVLVADEKGDNIISLLSGHLGGGNQLTRYLAEQLDANPVITTASDVNELLAVDVWAQKNELVITDMKLAKQAAAAIVAGRQIPFYCEGGICGNLPKEFVMVSEEKKPEIAVSVHTGWDSDVLHLVPKAVTMGIGCKRGKPFEEIQKQAEQVLRENQISKASICKIASIDLKAEEAGLCALAENWAVPFETFSAEELQMTAGIYESSEFVKNITGVDNVCERAAMAVLSQEEQKTAEFICRKTAADGVTIALVCREWGVSFE